MKCKTSYLFFNHVNKWITAKSDNYGTISLTIHASKILSTIIYRRLEQAIECSLGEDQFGFREERGTREALLSLRLIQNGRLGVGKPTFIASVDLEKALTRSAGLNLSQF